ncbi:MAG: dienelactone hydrolase family protein [Myxococcota bacterium]
MELLQPTPPDGGAVLVVHSWWGLTDSFRAFGRRLQREGFVVGLSDLFSGEVATTEGAARRLRARRRTTPMYRELGRDLDTLRGAAAPGARVGVVGFSMGGHWAVWLSQRPEYGIAATALFYAARGGSFARSRSSYLAHFAERDPWVRQSARRSMEAAIARAGRPYTSFDYAGTDHWFAEPSCPNAYAAPSAELAFRRTADFLLGALRSKR